MKTPAANPERSGVSSLEADIGPQVAAKERLYPSRMVLPPVLDPGNMQRASEIVRIVPTPSSLCQTPTSRLARRTPAIMLMIRITGIRQKPPTTTTTFSLAKIFHGHPSFARKGPRNKAGGESLSSARGEENRSFC
jgi:hypothetical protein